MGIEVRTIVVGVATVDELDPVLPSAVRLAERTGATLRIVHVVDLPNPRLAGRGGEERSLGAEYVEAAGAAVEARLRAHCARLTPATERIQVHTLAGSAHQELTALAASVEADLLVIGATRRGRIWRSILGTTAERVLRATTVPVLVLHQPFFRPVSRVLLTTDLTELSAGIHDLGLDVVEGLFGPGPFECRSVLALGPHPQMAVESVEEIARREMESFLGGRAPRGYPVTPRVMEGDPATVINVEADSWNADLIVLGTHGRTGLARYVFGSVAASTLRDATRNVLVIPASSEAATHAANGAGADSAHY